jgi:hypothetical protein
MNFKQAPYLRVQRKFPPEAKDLSEQVDQAYIDIAIKVNARTIGIFTDRLFLATGEQWYLNGSIDRQQTLRQVYNFSDGNLVFAHGINFASITNFTRIYGTFFDTSTGLWNTLPYIDIATVTKQINVTIDAVNVNINKGAASTAVITKGLLVLEWLSQK